MISNSYTYKLYGLFSLLWDLLDFFFFFKIICKTQFSSTLLSLLN